MFIMHVIFDGGGGHQLLSLLRGAKNEMGFGIKVSVARFNLSRIKSGRNDALLHILLSRYAMNCRLRRQENREKLESQVGLLSLASKSHCSQPRVLVRHTISQFTIALRGQPLKKLMPFWQEI